MWKIDSNQDVKKLLYYNDKDPLSKPNIDESLIDKKILPLPREIKAEDEESSQIFVYFKNMKPTFKNGIYYQDLILNIDIICHQNLFRFNGGIRPYRLESIIESTITETGLKETSLIDNIHHNYSSLETVNSKFSAICIVYRGTISNIRCEFDG